MSDADAMLRATIEKYFGTAAEEIDEVLESLATRHLDGGEWLFRQGDAGDSLYFLIRGRLQVWVTPEGAATDAGPTLLGEVVPGDSVGEISLLTGAPRTTGIRAIRDSQLIRVDRAQFEALARRHPTLVLQLAGRIASVLRERTSRAAAVARSFKTIAMVRLGTGGRVNEFCAAFTAALESHGRTLALSSTNLDRYGAPVSRLETADAVPEALRQWVHDQENASRFLVYDCEAAATPWSIFAMQQCDLVVFVADARTNPEPDTNELRLDAATSASNARRMLVLLQPESSTPIEGTDAWLGPRKIDFHLHVRADQPDELARVARVISGTALGLVLAAGAARGIAHLGVYKAMCEAGMRPDWIGGTSIGAIMGASIAKGWSVDEVISVPRDAFAKVNPFADYTIPLIALLRGRRFERLIKEHLPGRIEDLPIPFFAVSCNLDSGALNLHETGSLPDALRASASMPGIMPPAVVNQQLAIDGAVLNNMPVDIMQSKPVGRVIAVDLASQKSYLVPFTSMPSPWAVLRGRLFPFFRKYRVPSLMTLLLKATEVGTLAHVRELGRRADLLLNPPVREFGMTDVKSFDRIVDAGYQYARVALAEWQKKQGVEAG
jgi:predicted acylesterase/phospholipase RssA/CRP-like cAMP-binding protein